MAEDLSDAERAKKLERAAALEKKLLFVKAAEIYLELGMKEEAAAAYEKGGDFSKAEDLFEKLGKTEDAERCKKAREESTNSKSWLDLQAEFQNENPY